MATTRKTKKKKTTRRKRPTHLDLGRLERGQLEMDGDRLMVRISRDSHPELYDVDRLSKSVRALMDTYKGKRKMRDLVDFLGETDKSLQIILRNHLENAMRKYLG